MYKEGDWYIYCDICGQRCWASESFKLSEHTGRGGLIVCNRDVDKIDYGLVPYIPRREQNVPVIRSNHTNTDNGKTKYDPEVDGLVYYLAESQTGFVLKTGQGERIKVYERS